MSQNTVRLHRVLAAPAEKVYRAFLDADGNSTGFGGEYRELVPGKRLRYTDVFDDPGLPGEIEVVVDLKAVSCGTEISIVQSGLPDVIPVESCYLGWQQSLLNLARLVEPNIPD